MFLRRLSNKLALRRTRPGYRSRFGGLWTDRADAAGRIEGMSRGDPERARALTSFVEHGYAILPGVVDDAVIDELLEGVERSWAGEVRDVLVEVGGNRSLVTPEARSGHGKLLDLHVKIDAARRAAFARPIRDFLATLFEDDVLLFQSLYLERGSEQPVHQDTAYVVVVPPLALAAAWIALEDIQPGSGELTYYPGSHRLPDHVFSSHARNWNRERDGEEARLAYAAGLHEGARELGLELEAFLPKRGDVLIWSADLAHGGSPVSDQGLTRRSFVCHYCPGSARPYYTGYAKHGAVRRSAGAGCLFSSAHYAPEA